VVPPRRDIPTRSRRVVVEALTGAPARTSFRIAERPHLFRSHTRQPLTASPDGVANVQPRPCPAAQAHPHEVLAKEKPEDRGHARVRPERGVPAPPAFPPTPEESASSTSPRRLFQENCGEDKFSRGNKSPPRGAPRISTLLSFLPSLRERTRGGRTAPKSVVSAPTRIVKKGFLVVVLDASTSQPHLRPTHRGRNRRVVEPDRGCCCAENRFFAPEPSRVRLRRFSRVFLIVS